MVSLTCPPAFWIGISLIAIGILALTMIGIWWRWLSTKNWKFTTSELPSNLWKPYKVKEPWRSINPQVQGMFYKIDLGRKRKFNGVQFDHGISNETPQGWRMWFFDETSGFVFPGKHRPPYIETGDKETRRGTVAIIVELNPPISARYIKVGIIEPLTKTNGEAYHWRIEAVFLKVRLWNIKPYIIGKFILDRL